VVSIAHTVLKPHSLVSRSDSMCAGQEHQPDAQGHPQSSYCTLPLFHPPHRADQVPPGGGYVSGDGHLFNCRNPAVLQNAFHVCVFTCSDRCVSSLTMT
jgi:hypothetical protein